MKARNFCALHKNIEFQTEILDPFSAITSLTYAMEKRNICQRRI